GAARSLSVSLFSFSFGLLDPGFLVAGRGALAFISFLPSHSPGQTGQMLHAWLRLRSLAPPLICLPAAVRSLRVSLFSFSFFFPVLLAVCFAALEPISFLRSRLRAGMDGRPPAVSPPSGRCRGHKGRWCSRRGSYRAL